MYVYINMYGQLQEETELLNSEERPQELEEVSEKIHKRFHIKETPGSSLVKVGGCVGLDWMDWVRLICGLMCVCIVSGPITAPSILHTYTYNP